MAAQARCAADREKARGRVQPHHERIAPAWQNWLPLPGDGPLGLEINFLAPQLILLPLTIWMSDIVTRLIDDPSVKFAQWLYKSMIVEDSIPPKPKLEQIV